jgi:hypothetical protein
VVVETPTKARLLIIRLVVLAVVVLAVATLDLVLLELQTQAVGVAAVPQKAERLGAGTVAPVLSS